VTGCIEPGRLRCEQAAGFFYQEQLYSVLLLRLLAVFTGRDARNVLEGADEIGIIIEAGLVARIGHGGSGG
jgi:hypothetical protein